MTVPEKSIGIVIFAHGSASGRNSLRNKLVAEKLIENNIGTFLFDLLSEQEQGSDKRLEKIATEIPGIVLNKFNIPLLTRRLLVATEWVVKHLNKKQLPISYFGSSSGAAAALSALSKSDVRSVVARSGRIDLVSNETLSNIVSPCLFIVGGKEKRLIKITKSAMKKLNNVKEKKLTLIENASHLLEEPEAIEKVAIISTDWIRSHL